MNAAVKKAIRKQKSNPKTKKQSENNCEAMMSAEEPELLWTLSEESVLALAREREWAEAYAADHPRCCMGKIYLDFLRRELAAAQITL